MSRPFRWTKKALRYQSLLLHADSPPPEVVWDRILGILSARADDYRPSEFAMMVSKEKELFDKVCQLSGIEVNHETDC